MEQAPRSALDWPICQEPCEEDDWSDLLSSIKFHLWRLGYKLHSDRVGYFLKLAYERGNYPWPGDVERAWYGASFEMLKALERCLQGIESGLSEPNGEAA